jgi:hypothetical protein
MSLFHLTAHSQSALGRAPRDALSLRSGNVPNALAPIDHKGLRRVGSPVRSIKPLGWVAE